MYLQKEKFRSIANGQNGSPVSAIKIHHFVHLPFTILFNFNTISTGCQYFEYQSAKVLILSAKIFKNFAKKVAFLSFFCVEHCH